MPEPFGNGVVLSAYRGNDVEYRKAVVLVVEDNPLIRMGAVDLVVAAGFEALEASDADAAIRILEPARTSVWCSPTWECPAPWTG